ncbi:MAG: transposase [Selenomonadaceae bacterium]|nr:transposase [Selenomonadaceae bacterium]
MYLTQVNAVRGLTKAEYFQLRELCFFSNCLYNFALYNVRQKYFADKTYLRFEANFGLDNLATCVTNFGTSFIMDGRKIKHINRNWNKRCAHLQSILSK